MSQDNIEFDTSEINQQNNIKSMTSIVIANISYQNQKSLFAISVDKIQSLISGDSALDRIMIPVFKIKKIRAALIKYPFMKPKVVIDPKFKKFIKLSNEFFYITSDPIYLQTNMISDFELIPNNSDSILSNYNTLVSEAESILFDRYYSEINYHKKNNHR